MNLRLNEIMSFCTDENIENLKNVLGEVYSQSELDSALEMTIAYSQTKTAEYLLSLGADIIANDYQGVYYAAHNDELTGLKFAISKGVDININKGMILNTGIITATNTKSLEMIEWLLNNGAKRDYLTIESLRIIDDYGTEKLKELIKSV